MIIKPTPVKQIKITWLNINPTSFYLSTNSSETDMFFLYLKSLKENILYHLK